MKSESKQAFKEWAIVCSALAAGRQSLLLRKGGIHERAGRFEVEHHEFWLFPTRFHQNAEEIREESRDLLQTVVDETPPAGTIPLSLYAVVEEVIEIDNETVLPRLADLQILTPYSVSERYHYRRPGLFVLPVRIYRCDAPVFLADSPHYAGCRTWVDLGETISTQNLTPVLAEAVYLRQVREIRRALSMDPR